MKPIAILLSGQITLLGASNTFGPSGIPPIEQYAPGWAEILDYKQNEPITNIAVPGATAWHWANWLVFFSFRVEDTVLLELGTNDARFIPPPGAATQAQFALRMDFITDYLLSHGAGRVVIATPPPLGPWLDIPEAEALLEQYALTINALCATKDNVECGPDLLHTLNVYDHINADGIHYTRSGNRRVAELWLHWLKKNQ